MPTWTISDYLKALGYAFFILLAWARVEAGIDKLMLFWLLVLGIGAAVYLQTRGNMDEGTLDWTRGLSTNILSGLLGLLGGASMASRILHNAGSDKPPTTPPSSDPKP